jgi:outer membrane protein assembly factor BamB
MANADLNVAPADTSVASTPQTKTRKPLRLWPGLVAAGLIVLSRFIVPFIFPDASIYAMLVTLVGILGVAIWWLFFSRARWIERIGAILLIVLGIFLAYRVIHVSIRTGAMGFLFYVLAVPVLSVVLVAWAAATRNLSDGVRRISLVVAIFLACGAFALIRTGGFTADFDNDFAWRWSKTSEDRLLAAGEEPAANTSSALLAGDAQWPGFRGPGRDGIVRGTKIKTDWTASPPVEMWRKPIGPGWSSFAVRGDRIFTQEQRGADEIVAAYNLNTGQPIWKHRDAARFYESNAGPGPRGTPTLHNGRVYALGATGILNVLNDSDGSVVWSRNASADTKSKLPGWGFSGSPLVIEDKVIVATAGKLVAYDAASGEPRWFGPDGGGGYSSPHLVKMNGVDQILLLGQNGAVAVSPSDGKVLWEHQWGGMPIIQPAVASGDNVLISVSESSGTRSLTIANGGSGWNVAERWTSESLNPYFNDFVVHNGHAYGFNWSSLVCIDLKDGSLKWKGGKFDHGQLVLLADQSLLLVLSEKGEVALVKAAPDQFIELGRFPAIKGKTWNHPVVVGNILLVRNGEEMAAFRLPAES